MFRAVSVLFATVALASKAYAADIACHALERRIEAQGIALSACKCDPSGLSAPNLGQSPQMKLTAACNRRTEANGYEEGDYLFSGDLVAHGILKWQRTTTFGDALAFDVNRSDSSRLPGLDSSFRFIGKSTVLATFKPPTLSARASCWSAAASIQVTSLYTAQDGGSDATGTYIEAFKVLRVGKYRKCKAE